MSNSVASPGQICQRCGAHMTVAGACATCGEPTDILERPIRIGEVIDGRYLVKNEIGHGGMGFVYAARDVGLERDVALKVLAPQRNATPAAMVGLRAEAAALASVRSDNVVQVYAFGPHGGSFFFAMEYVHGENLAALLAEHVRHHAAFPLGRAVSILRSVASGLGEAHAHGIVHRDVKPGNIVIEHRSGRAVLLDFGLALRAGDTSNERASGTPAYMAPEQIAEGTFGEVSSRTDVYALGCTAFELLTGRVPFDESDFASMFQAHLFRRPPVASSLRHELAAFDETLARALEKEPGRRFQSVGAFAAALDESLARSLAPEPTLVDVSAVSEEVVGPAGARTVDVLVVDDDPIFRRLAARCVQLAWYRRRFRVRAVASGEAAMAAARDALPRLIVLDYRMPGMDGLETLTSIRDLAGGTSTRVVVVSSSIGSIERWRFGALGVSDFVNKPIEMTSFVALLSEIASDAGWGTASDASSGAG